MIKRVDPCLPPEVLFLLWGMGHGDEVAVVDSRYGIDQDGDAEMHGAVVQMGDVDILQAIRGILSAVQLATNFVDDPVRQIEHARSGPRCELRRAVQDEVDDALGFRCSILGVARTEFHKQVKNCYGLIITGDTRKQGNFILRKGLDVTPASILSRAGRAAGDGRREQARPARRRGADPHSSRLLLRPWVLDDQATVIRALLSLARFAGVDPTLKSVDLLFGPRAVTGHCTGANSGENVVGVGGDVVIRPEVERELHRLPVPRPEHRHDVFFKADWLHRCDPFRSRFEVADEGKALKRPANSR